MQLDVATIICEARVHAFSLLYWVTCRWYSRLRR